MYPCKMSAARSRLLTPSFFLLFGITFLTFFAAFQLFPTVPLRLRELGASLAESGRFMTVFTFGSACGALFTGPLGDLIGQRRMMFSCALFFALFAGFYGLASNRLWVYGLALPHGVVWSGLLTATMTTLGRVLPEDQRADGLALYGLASPGGCIFGPMAGLAILSRFGFSSISFILALLFSVLAFLILVLPKDLPRHPVERGWLQKPNAKIWAPCAVLFTTALGYGALGTYTAQEGLQLAFPTVFNLPTTATFLTCMSIGMVGIRIIMGRIGFGSQPVRLLPTMLTIAFLALLMLALLPGGALRHTISGLLYGGSYGLVHTLVNTHVLDTTPVQGRGAAFGAILFSFDSGIGLGSALIGTIIGQTCLSIGPLGYRLGWLAAAIAAGFAISLSKKMLNQKADPAPAP